MIPGIFTGEPLWLVVPCLFLAGFYAFALYFRDRRNEFPLLLVAALALMRFIAVFLISFLLLAPFTRSITREKEKPVVLVVLDNSASIVLGKDSSYYRDQFTRDLDELNSGISGIAEVRTYFFGPEPAAADPGRHPDFSAKTTDLSAVFPALDNLYGGLNVGAMILASDGIFNAGSNPLYQAKNRPYPLYTLALGDTTIRMDQLISRVNFNRLVYLNNRFPIEITVQAHEMAGKKGLLRVFTGGAEVFSEEFLIDRTDYTGTFTALFDARETGLRKYTVQLDVLEGELSPVNNRKDIFIEVLESRNRILVLAAAPHPDISALRQAIGENENYEADFYLSGEFTGPVDPYNLVILHQLPSGTDPAGELIGRIREKNLPVLFIAGQRTDFNRLNQYQPGMAFSAARLIFEESVPSFNRDFSAFTLSDETRSWFSDLPPLLVPLGSYQVSNAARVIINQRLGSVETSRPMILVSESPDGRTGIISGEGIWKWRLFDYARHQDHRHFNELINKIIQYLGLREQKKNFRVSHAAEFTETQGVIFDAEVYNENYELITDPEVGLVISNEEGKQFPYIFNKAGQGYYLDAGRFPPGSYSWTARAESGLKTLTDQGRFSVSAINLESLSTTADHQMLRQLATENGGKMFLPGEIDRLAEEILSRDDIRPVTFSRKIYKDLLTDWRLLTLVLMLLTAEWFLRKRAGSY